MAATSSCPVCSLRESVREVGKELVCMGCGSRFTVIDGELCCTARSVVPLVNRSQWSRKNRRAFNRRERAGTNPGQKGV